MNIAFNAWYLYFALSKGVTSIASKIGVVNSDRSHNFEKKNKQYKDF